MKLKLPLLPMILLVFLQPLLAATPVDTIRNYIQITYGDKLQINDDQIKQLSWVMDSSVVTPEMESRELSQVIHREVPRALSRLYCLQLLRSGKNDDYQLFINPQSVEDKPKLNKDSFLVLSKRISGLDDESYAVLQASAIISATTLSVKAKARAVEVMSAVLPEDSVQFLSVTAPYAGSIYPLAEKVIKKYPGAQRKLEVAFYPNSHLRHMMYNEGSLDMYAAIKKGIGNGSFTQDDLNFWYDYWVINIAGFRGHLEPVGSLYLGQRTYMAMHQVKLALDKMVKDRKVNPMILYLQKRSSWLHLSSLTNRSQEKTALASLAASLRLFTSQDGKALFQSFRSLSETDQRRWITYAERQLTILNTPAPTYAPALLANAVNMGGLSKAIIKVLPVMLDGLELADKLRTAGVFKSDIALSFREMARSDVVTRIIESDKPLVVDINTNDGIVRLK